MPSPRRYDWGVRSSVPRLASLAAVLAIAGACGSQGAPAPGQSDGQRYLTDEGYRRAELQASLDRVCEFAEANVGKVGTEEFPIAD